MLDAFPPRHVSVALSQVDATPAGDWPDVHCLAILFTSRSGSSHLGREITRRFEVGRIEESFNAPRINREGGGAEGLKRIIALDSENGWFALKTSNRGLIIGEALGFLEAAREKTGFIFLVRRDIVAQAVSIVKAQQTQRWHSIAPPSSLEPTFVSAAVAEQIGVVETIMRMLKGYLDRAGRPWRLVAYEDFHDGDMSKVESACLALGAPMRAEVIAPVNPLEKTWDEVNADWVARFEPDPKTAATIERYQDLVATAGPPPPPPPPLRRPPPP